MKEINPKEIKIQSGFWGQRLTLNATKAIHHQWEQLEKTGCIQNFRLVADQADGVREGFFFADSDAYKWLDAAARVYASYPTKVLLSRMDDFIDLIARTQSEDGYIYTYNQVHFPGLRWQNLQIEHELYCLGHLIEAAVSHFEVTGNSTLLDIGIKAADLLVGDFSQAGPEGTPGHQEIEIALIRLYRTTKDQRYLDLAEHFIEQRGRIKPFITHILAINKGFEARGREVEELHADYLTRHPDHAQQYQLPKDNVASKPPWGKQRWFVNMATGKYFQQHKPVRQQTIPVGHAVRFAYLETAIAMLVREREDPTLLDPLVKAWEHMVERRMYLTGGTGSLPNIEGFGRDYELDPVYSYSETCAALGDILWNWEMTLISGKARYADLTEWQLYNATAVGLGLDGTSYLYNNPLACDGGVTRQAWFKCPCCPSNISRVWADLGKLLYSQEEGVLWVHQYVSSRWVESQGLNVVVSSGLPWTGKVSIRLEPDESREFALNLRVPSWSDGFSLRVNGEPIQVDHPPPNSGRQTASGYHPSTAWYLTILRSWSPDDLIDIEFKMDIHLRATHPRVKATRGQVALTRGPLVYCLESIDNPGSDLFHLRIDPSSLNIEYSPVHFDGITVLRGQTTNGRKLTFIPYYLWANRGESQMTVYVGI